MSRPWLLGQRSKEEESASQADSQQGASQDAQGWPQPPSPSKWWECNGRCCPEKDGCTPGAGGKALARPGYPASSILPNPRGSLCLPPRFPLS